MISCAIKALVYAILNLCFFLLFVKEFLGTTSFRSTIIRFFLIYSVHDCLRLAFYLIFYSLNFLLDFYLFFIILFIA